MGHPDGAHTHGSGGSGLGEVFVILLAWQLWRTRVDAARAMPPRTLVTRAAQPLPQAQRAGELPAASQREPPGGLHLHFHGVSAEDIAAVLNRRDDP